MKLIEAQSIIFRMLERNRDRADTYYGLLTAQETTALTLAIKAMAVSTVQWSSKHADQVSALNVIIPG